MKKRQIFTPVVFLLLLVLMSLFTISIEDVNAQTVVPTSSQTTTPPPTTTPNVNEKVDELERQIIELQKKNQQKMDGISFQLSLTFLLVSLG